VEAELMTFYHKIVEIQLCFATITTYLHHLGFSKKIYNPKKYIIMANLKFKNCRQITAKNYKELSEVQLQQMAISASLGYGDEYTTAEHFLEQSGDGDINDAVVELWDVVATENPDTVLYECWVYLADTANVFFVGTTKDTEAAMCQWSFDDHTKDESNQELCADLQEAFDKKK
jgi:hypothetical protein